MVISAQNPTVKFQSSHFQDELDSTVLVSKGAKGYILEASFVKKTGKVISETERFLSIAVEWTETVKTFSKRDIACAITNQKETLKRTPRKRAILSDSASQSETEEPAKKRLITKRARRYELLS